jgi:hypothetical protein
MFEVLHILLQFRTNSHDRLIFYENEYHMDCHVIVPILLTSIISTT